MSIRNALPLIVLAAGIVLSASACDTAGADAKQVDPNPYDRTCSTYQSLKGLPYVNVYPGMDVSYTPPAGQPAISLYAPDTKDGIPTTGDSPIKFTLNSDLACIKVSGGLRNAEITATGDRATIVFDEMPDPSVVFHARGQKSRIVIKVSRWEFKLPEIKKRIGDSELYGKDGEVI